MQLIGHGRATDDQRQGQHHFNLILLDAFDHAVSDVADQAAEQHSANGLAGKQNGSFADTWGFPQLSNTQQYGEDHHGSAVIEQRLTDNGGFQRFGGVGGTQGAEYGNRVGRRNQGTEQQAVQQADVPAEQGKDPVRQVTDDHRCDQHADSSQQANGPTVAAQVGEVDVQGAGKQQKRKHPVHQQIVEVDLAHQALHAFFQAGVANHAQTLQQQGKQQCRDHHADGRWQADEAVVQVSEECRQTDKRSNKLKHSGSCNGFQFGTRSYRAAF
ncbi:hypothetical protein D3C72_1302090 [compost metagenome]